MPIILTFDSQVTRNRVLDAARKMGRKGPGAFPIDGQENLYFTELPRRRSQSGPARPTQNDDKVTVMREDLLTSWRSHKNNGKSQRQRGSHNDGPLGDLVNQVANIIPLSRIDIPPPPPRDNSTEMEIKESLFDNLVALSTQDNTLSADQSQTEKENRK